MWVEPGEHEIVFTYRTRMFSAGALLSLLAAAALSAYMVYSKKKKLP